MNNEETKRRYEMSYFLTAETPEDKIDSNISELNSLIAENGGENITMETAKRKWLSYPVKKQKEAYFGVAYFNIVTEELDKIKKSLALNKKILRFMIINKPPKLERAAVTGESISAPTQQSFDQKLENILNR